MLPAVVILDPELTVGLPPKITAATGMDALSHSLEAYCSPFYHPMAVGIAVEGIRLVRLSAARLRKRRGYGGAPANAGGVEHGRDGFPAAWARCAPGAPVGAVRRASRPAQRDPDAICAARQPERHRVAHRSAARYLELPDPSFDSFLDWVLEMRAGIPHTLTQIGIDAKEAERIGRMAHADGSAGTIRFHSRRRRMRASW